MAYDFNSTHTRHGLHPSLRGLGFLGDTPGITPQEAVAQAMATESNWNTRDSQSATFTGGMASEVAAGQVSAGAFSSSCSTQPAPNVNLFQTGASLALGTSAAGIGIAGAAGAIAASTAALAGAVTMGVGAIIGVIGVIFAHHAAAARQEQQLGCAAIAAGNNAFALIEQAVNNGHMTPSDASAALDEIVSKVGAMMAPSIGHNPCNADCEVLVAFKAIAIYRKARYAALTTQQSSQAATLQQQAAAAQASGDTATANVLLAQAAALQPSGSVPSWVWLAGIGFLVWKFL